MKIATMAVRMVARRRRLMLRASIPLGFAAFVTVLTLALLGEVSDQIARFERTQLRGELRSETRLGDVTGGYGPADLSGTDLAPGVMISTAYASPAVLETDGQSVLCTVWFTSLKRELEFRGLTHGDAELPASGDAELPMPDDAALHVPGLGTLNLEGIQAVALAEGRPSEAPWVDGRLLILLPWEVLPGAVDSSGLIMTRIVRARGVTPFADEVAEQVAVTLDLSPTGWEEQANERMQQLAIIAAILIGFLTLAGGIAAAPSASIVVRRHGTDFRLLIDTGYSRSRVVRLVTLVSALSGGISALIGAAAAAIFLTIAGLRGGVAPSFLPLFWQSTNPPLAPLAPAAPLLPMIIAIGLAMLVGALSALPAAKVAATIGPHGRLWR